MKGESHVETVPIVLGDTGQGLTITRPKFHIGQKVGIGQESKAIVIGMTCLEYGWEYTLSWVGIDWVEDEVREDRISEISQ